MKPLAKGCVDNTLTSLDSYGQVPCQRNASEIRKCSLSIITIKVAGHLRREDSCDLRQDQCLELGAIMPVTTSVPTQADPFDDWETVRRTLTVF